MVSVSRTRRLAATGLVACALAVIAGCGGDDDSNTVSTATPDGTTATEPVETTAATPEPTPDPQPKPKPEQPAVVTVKIVVNDGRAVGGIVRPRVKKGQKLTLVVTVDVADHVHLHGYDKMVDVAPGRPARLPFTATIPGRFEVELEDSGVQIAEVEVRP